MVNIKINIQILNNYLNLTWNNRNPGFPWQKFHSARRRHFVIKFDFNLRTKLVTCYIWNRAFVGAETWTFPKKKNICKLEVTFKVLLGWCRSLGPMVWKNEVGFRLLWPCIMNVGWRERNQQDATNLMFIIKLLSQHVSGIIMPIIRRTRVCTAAYGVLHWLWCLWLCGAGTWAVFTVKVTVRLFEQ